MRVPYCFHWSGSRCDSNCTTTNSRLELLDPIVHSLITDNC